MPKTIPTLAQDLIRQLLIVKPEQRLGANNINDLMSHKFFDGIDFATIQDMDPPEKFELTKMQAIMAKYLPHNVQKTMQSKQSEGQVEEATGEVIQTTPTLRKVYSQNLHIKNVNSSNSSNSNLGRYDGEKSENCLSD